MHRKYTALLLCAAAVLVTGCGGKSSSSSSESETAAVTSSTAASDEKTVTASETVTTRQTTESKTTAAVTETETTQETTEPESETDDGYATEETEETTEPTTFAEADKYEHTNSSDCIEAARAFYQAYLDHDAEKVYSMFEKTEIDGYNDKIAPELGGVSAKEMFRRAAVIRAIEASMDNIGQIMDYYADGKSDEWSFKLDEDDLDDVDEEELKEFNKSLGTSYTRACACRYMFYNDDTNGASFTGNSSAFVELDGKWYLSYSSVMGTDLLNFIEVENISTDEEE